MEVPLAVLQVTTAEISREEEDDGTGLVESNHGAISLFEAHKQAGFCMGAGNESRQELRTNHTEKRCLPSWMLPSSCSWMAETHTHTHGETEHAERFASCAKFSVFAFAALDPPISLSSPQLFSLPVFRNRSISTVYSVTLQAVFIPRHKSLLSPTDYFTNAHK